MERSFNQHIILGRIGADAELRYTQSGKSVSNFSVATSFTSGEREITTWHRVVCWKSENLNQYLTKGARVLITGYIQTREYEGQDGKQRVTETITQASGVVLLGEPSGRRQEEQKGGNRQRSRSSQRGNQQSQTTSPAGNDLGVSDEDVPF